MRNRAIRWSVVVASAFAVLWVFFPAVIPLGIDGRPQDVAHRLLEAVRDGDYAGARALWTPEGIRNAERNSGLAFKDLCRDRFLCDRWSFASGGPGKGGLYHVGFIGEGGSGRKSYNIYFERTRGGWRVVEDLIYPVRPRSNP
jgi:hypothetical protein